MPVNNVNNNTQDNSIYRPNQVQVYTEEKDNAKLDVSDFLQIMAAEISNQNPFSSEGGSGSKTDYISQLAQFTNLEQMSEITESLSLLTLMGQQQYAFSLIGQPVVARGEEGEISGVVDKVKFKDGFAILVIDGKEYGMGQLVEVGNKLREQEDTPPVEDDNSEGDDPVVEGDGSDD